MRTYIGCDCLRMHCAVLCTSNIAGNFLGIAVQRWVREGVLIRVKREEEVGSREVRRVRGLRGVEGV